MPFGFSTLLVDAVSLISGKSVAVGLVHLPIATRMTAGPVGLMARAMPDLSGANGSAQHLFTTTLSRTVAALEPHRSADLQPRHSLRPQQPFLCRDAERRVRGSVAVITINALNDLEEQSAGEGLTVEQVGS